MSDTDTILPELLTGKQAAHLLGLGERTLWRYARSGVCPPPVKLGDSKNAPVRYRRAELLEWIKGGCTPWSTPKRE